MGINYGVIQNECVIANYRAVCCKHYSPHCVFYNTESDQSSIINHSLDQSLPVYPPQSTITSPPSQNEPTGKNRKKEVAILFLCHS